MQAPLCTRTAHTPTTGASLAACKLLLLFKHNLQPTIPYLIISYLEVHFDSCCAKADVFHLWLHGTAAVSYQLYDLTAHCGLTE
jgi:hypothetical protein